MSKESLPVIENRNALKELLSDLKDRQIYWEGGVLIVDQDFRNAKIGLVDVGGCVVASLILNISHANFRKLRSEIAPARKWQVIVTCDEVPVGTVLAEVSYARLGKMSKRDVEKAFSQPDRPKCGRQGSIKKVVARLVFHDAHMRCMFEGCGEDLSLNAATGDEDYFGYLAHIVPASPDGPRGNKCTRGECKKLVSDRNNIMLLCDKCHRLVDRVAPALYSRARLNAMRANHIESAKRYLSHLRYMQVPIAEFLWPVNGQIVAWPSNADIAAGMRPLELSWNGVRRKISNMNQGEADDKSAEFWRNAPRLITKAALKCHDLMEDSPVVGLFAFASMPALIGLGALLGNKSRAIPVPKRRSTEEWSWPHSEGSGEFFDVAHDNQSATGTDAVIQINFTAVPESLTQTRIEIQRELDARAIVFSAKVLGNDCLGHPEDGLLFQNEITKILNDLKSKQNIGTVHLLVCASNSACVYLGRAIEQYGPRVKVYDFLKEKGGKVGLKELIEIVPTNEGPKLICNLLDAGVPPC